MPVADDQEYMNWIYEQYKRLMFYTARKYVNDGFVIEDLVQDTIEKLIPKIPTLRQLSRCALNSYVVISVRNICINYLRRQERIQKYVSTDDLDDTDIDINENQLSPEDLLILNEKKQDFIAIWKKLPGKDRDLLAGKCILALDDWELAEMCKCKPDSIRMLLTRARRRAFAKMKEASLYYDEK